MRLNDGPSALPSYIIGADLGQMHDYTAIVVVEVWEHQRFVPTYDVIRLVRPELGTPYTALPGLLRTLEEAVQQRWADTAFESIGQGVDRRLAPVDVVIDRTGVGVAVSDLLREAGLDHISITITGGDTVIQPEHDHYRVPKRDLCGRVQTTLQQRRLRIADDLPEARILRQELSNFKAKISLGGHDSYGAGEDWRSGNHDDTVLGTACAVWYGEHLAAMRPGEISDELLLAFSGLPR